MGLVRLWQRVGTGWKAVQPTDQIVCDLSRASITPAGSSSAATLADLLGRAESCRYGKAINAVATTAAAGGFGGLIAFVTATNPDAGSNTVRCLSAPVVPLGTGSNPGSAFETQLLAWLGAAANASPAGVGLSSTSAPTLLDTITSLRLGAFAQSL